MRMTPIQPRTLNGLRGFGFTVSWDEPASASSEAVAAASERADETMAAAARDGGEGGSSPDALPADTNSTAATPAVDTEGSNPALKAEEAVASGDASSAIDSEPDQGQSGAMPGSAGAPAVEGGAHNPTPSTVSNVVPIKKQWKQSDPAHRDCLNPSQCGGFSNLRLCPQCTQAAGMSQVEHRGVIR